MSVDNIETIDSIEDAFRNIDDTQVDILDQLRQLVGTMEDLSLESGLDPSPDVSQETAKEICELSNRILKLQKKRLPQFAVRSKARKSRNEPVKEYLEECKKKAFLISMPSSEDDGYTSLQTIFDTKTKIEVFQGAKMGPGKTEEYLAPLDFPNGKPLGAFQTIQSDDIDLHYYRSYGNRWLKAFTEYAKATKYGVLIVAVTAENFLRWATSTESVNEVKDVPKGRLYVYIEHDDEDEGGSYGYLVNIDPQTYEGSATVSDGKGYLLYHDGSYYHGELKDGLKHGEGKGVFASGNIYEGEHNNDQRHGTGKLMWAGGDVFEGEFRQGNMRKGKFTWADGEVYEGEYKRRHRGKENRNENNYDNDDEYDGAAYNILRVFQCGDG